MSLDCNNPACHHRPSCHGSHFSLQSIDQKLEVTHIIVVVKYFVEQIQNLGYTSLASVMLLCGHTGHPAEIGDNRALLTVHPPKKVNNNCKGVK